MMQKVIKHRNTYSLVGSGSAVRALDVGRAKRKQEKMRREAMEISYAQLAQAMRSERGW